MPIALVTTAAQIRACHPVLVELRPHLGVDELVAQVERQASAHGFQLAALWGADGEVKAVAGFRIAEWLSGGRYLEIEDLAAGERSRGYGGALFDWIVALARREQCRQVRLVSHVRRFAAHRFYLGKRMILEAHYFSLALEA
jgi:GNAT superfamily N-acetyltransferase